ncbi:hypothetical protein BHE74_00057515, partial [Ensete ventricosum]
MRTVHYRVVPPKSTVSGQLREKSTVGGRLREKKKEEEEEKKKEEEEEKKKEVPPFLVLSSPVRRRHPRVAHALSPPLPVGDFSPVREDGSSPCPGRKI